MFIILIHNYGLCCMCLLYKNTLFLNNFLIFTLFLFVSFVKRSKQKMRKNKIAFFADILISDFDGASRTMFQLINRIPADQFEFLFVCGMGPDNIAGFKCIRVSNLSIPGNEDYKVALPMLQKNKLDEELELFEPDVIHISTPSMLGNYALKAARRYEIPVISIYHTNFVSYIDYYLGKLPFLINLTKQKARNILNSFYNRCDKVYVPSESLAEELVDGGMQSKLLKIWKRGIDRKLFSPSKKDKNLMKSLTGNDNPCILFVSRLVWEKNLQTMFNVYKLIEEKHLKYNFIVVGDGVAKDDAEKQMPNAFFLGHCDHEKLASVYASADVFFFPSVTETFGNVVLEAMACGLPCVIADGGGSRDFITNAVNGFLCKSYDAQDFLNRISSIIEQPELARKLSCNGLESSKSYIWENLADTYFGDLKLLSHTHRIPMLSV